MTEQMADDATVDAYIEKRKGFEMVTLDHWTSSPVFDDERLVVVALVRRRRMGITSISQLLHIPPSMICEYLMDPMCLKCHGRGYRAGEDANEPCECTGVPNWREA